MNLQSARHRRIFWRKNKRKILIVIYALILYVLLILMIQHSQSHKQKYISPLPTTNAGSSAQMKSVEITPTPTPTDEQFINSLPHGQIVWQTYGHESSFGKNDACKNQGLFNGFGFAQNDAGYQCFASLKEVATKVSGWFADYIEKKGYTTREALCIYRYGHTNGNCDYADYTLAL